VTFTARDAQALTRRLLAEEGVADGALMIAHADVVRVVASARYLGDRAAWSPRGARQCRVCGCTALMTCRTTDPCHWVGPDLCSACEPYVREGGP